LFYLVDVDLFVVLGNMFLQRNFLIYISEYIYYNTSNGFNVNIRIYMSSKEQFEYRGNGLLVRAPAKLNLSLLVGPKRDDGFHEISTVMAKIDLYDELFFEKTDGEGIELVCDGQYWAPGDASNLVVKACHLLGVNKGLKITLTKNIPAGAGLAGGSSNAAATLLGVNKLLDLNFDDNELHRFASALGSDIAFFLGGPLALCTGRGEKIEEIPKNFNFRAILVLSDVNVSTKEIYGDYRCDKAKYEQLNEEIFGLLRENRIDLIAKMCANMLEDNCLRLEKSLGDKKRDIESYGIDNLVVTGSGSAMYFLLNNFERQTRSGSGESPRTDITRSLHLV